jgi:hypothetical protein
MHELHSQASQGLISYLFGILRQIRYVVASGDRYPLAALLNGVLGVSDGRFNR